MWSDNEASIDLLRFRSLAKTIDDVITTDSLLPTTIGVFGDWGSGKSTLLKMIQHDLDGTDGVMSLTFNGWLFEGYEDAKTALMGSIIDALEERAKANESIMKHTRSKLRGIVRLIHSFAASCGEFDPPWIKKIRGTHHETAWTGELDASDWACG
jgi:predicted KAP-like P-loop ATPase